MPDNDEHGDISFEYDIDINGTLYKHYQIFDWYSWSNILYLYIYIAFSLFSVLQTTYSPTPYNTAFYSTILQCDNNTYKLFRWGLSWKCSHSIRHTDCPLQVAPFTNMD